MLYDEKKKKKVEVLFIDPNLVEPWNGPKISEMGYFLLEVWNYPCGGTILLTL